MLKKSTTTHLEDAEFREAVEGTLPLHHDQIEPFHRRLPPRPLSHPRPGTIPGEALTEAAAEAVIAPEDELYFARPGVQHRLMRDLKRGHIEIRDTLDLHGMTSAFASEELGRFLAFCLQQRCRCVRIIHGKGYGSANGRPALKQKVDLWLRQHRDVLGFCSARRRDGGTGAVYVLLRSRR